MAKSQQKLKARKLRRGGMSIIKIADTVKVAKSTVSLWCRDIELTERQKLILLNSKENGLRRGQLIGAEIQKKRRLDRIDKYRLEGIKKLSNLTLKQYFSAGLTLYLAEGSKERRIIFTNSDPRVVKFMISWFRTFFNVPTEDFAFYLIINQIHKTREKIVKNYWSEYLNMSIKQFRKTSFVKAKQKKVYENHHKYYGAIHFQILKSTELSYKIKGLLVGLFEAKVLNRIASV